MEKENTLAPFPPSYVKPEDLHLHAIASRVYSTIDLEEVFNELVKLVEHERTQCAIIAHTASLDNEWDGRTAFVIEQAIRGRSEPLKPKPQQESQEHEESPQI